MDSIKSFYDRNAEVHRAVPVDPRDAAAAIAAPGHRYFCILDAIRDPQNRIALELGFGAPEISNALARRFAEFEGADISASVFAKHSDIAFPVRDVDLNADWPYADSSWDVIIAMMIFEHLFDPFHSFGELARILRPGGHAFVNLPNIAALKCRWSLLRGRAPTTSTKNWFALRQWDGGHLHNFDIDNVRRVGESAGLELARIYPVGNLIGIKRLWPGLFCHEISYVFVKPD